jgi:hypothetical protein
MPPPARLLALALIAAGIVVSGAQALLAGAAARPANVPFQDFRGKAPCW